MKTYIITYKLEAGQEFTAEIHGDSQHHAERIAKAAFEKNVISVIGKEEYKEQALLDLLIMEHRFTLERHECGFAVSATWHEYNKALDKVCDLLGIDSVDFAEALEDRIRKVAPIK